MEENSSRDNREKNVARDSKNTRSFKHVNVKRERPHLSRGEEDKKQTGTSKNRSTYSDGQHKPAPSGAPKKDPNAKLHIIPLGGLDAIGKNMTVFECKNDIILDDAGLMFPDDDHPGIDLILPDYTYVLENADKLRGIIITHGHEDHTGSLPYLLKDLDRSVPIYASKLTLGLIEVKLEEFKIRNVKLVEVKPGQVIKLGCMTAEFFSVNHSIPAALGVFYQSPAGNVLHTGDFKLDQTPIDGVHTDFAAISKFSTIGVDLMLSDSTNAQNPNFTPSEAEVGKTLKRIIMQSKKKIVVASFASHIHRMQQICNAAVESGRKVVVTGRSMIQNTDIARRLGYLKVSDSNLIDAYEIKNIPSEQIVVMCTGSQGEPLSALARMAAGEHKTIDIEEGDTVIISATPVPGNEKKVTRVINSLAKIGADVYDKSRAMVHVSGHASAEELKLMLSMVKPKAFMPVHGESAHLHAHAKLAATTGVPERNIFICDNGESLELSSKGVRRGKEVQSGIVFVDGLSVGDTSQGVLDERSALSAQGFATVACALSLRERKIIGNVKVEMHGITGGDEYGLHVDAIHAVTRALKRSLEKGAPLKEIEKVCKNALLTILWERTKQRPMVIVSIIEI